VGNDHLTTPLAIRVIQTTPPNFYEPLITYASLASVTHRIRFMLGVIVLPEREIILLAKQLATLDQLSKGRLMLGVGIGSYREEFEAVHPELKGANRGRMMDEGIILLNAHADVGLVRVGASGDGWIVAGLAFDRTAEARTIVDDAARKAGRNPASIPLHFQLWLSFGSDRQSAIEKLRRSQHWRRTLTVHTDLDEDEHLQRFTARNLLGTPDEVVQQIHSFQQRTTVDHIGVVMLGENTRELLEDMQLFARDVMPAFATDAPTNP
jgi:alkanesulfonate monooxygenase SsuD/methylene tetrahydromethanopterin reductase-like flavin-dependent oxidoreductase (luciferase family)